MSEYTSFESRVASLKAAEADVYNFASDIRNFERFLPEGSVTEFKVSESNCSFNVPSIGNVVVELIEKNPTDKIVFKAILFGSNEFFLTLSIDGEEDFRSSAHISIKAILNPVMKMMVNDPIKKFLNLLVDEMESFTAWK
jgi:hypothetical protein